MKRKLESMEDLLQAVEYYGFLPFFPNDIPGFSVEEICAPVSPIPIVVQSDIP